MALGPTPPLVSKELETPDPSAWLYGQPNGYLGVSTIRDPAERRRACRDTFKNYYEKELFDFDALQGFAQSAVQAEQDLIEALIEKCASVVTPHCKAEDNCAKLANETLSELAELRRLVMRGRASHPHGGEKEPSWWRSEDDIEKWTFARNFSRRFSHPQ
jgi:hypothetical protein